MSEIPRVGDLQVDQHLTFEHREWTVQRIAWVLMVLIVLAAVLGFLGPGPLTRLTAGDKGGALWVEYDRFGRYEAPGDLKVHIGPAAVQGGQARVWVSRKYLSSLDLEKVTPEPERVEASPDRLTYVFRVADSSAPTLARFSFKPQEFWGHEAAIGVEGGPEARFEQFFYP